MDKLIKKQKQGDAMDKSIKNALHCLKDREHFKALPASMRAHQERAFWASVKSGAHPFDVVAKAIIAEFAR